MKPRVSVITCHIIERPDLIKETYESLLNQSESNWEWLIEADSKDQLDDIRKDPRVKIRNNNSLQIPQKRNRALLSAQGDYVACLDDDDTYPKNSLKSRADALDRFPKAAFSFGVVTDSEGSHPSDPLPKGIVNPGEIYDIWKETKRLGKKKVLPAPAGVMWRKKVIWEMGGWLALPRSEDTALLMRASIKYPAFFVDEETYCIRQHAGRLTNNPYWKEEVWEWVEKTTEEFKNSIK